jgi:hypothetical protein
MTSFTVGPISVDIQSEPVSIMDKPVRGAEEQAGIAANPAFFSTLDGWRGRFGFFAFEGMDKLTGKFYWHKDPVLPPYDRLERAGTISVVNEGGKWVTTLRALKKVDKDHPNLRRVTEEDLDYLAGSGFIEFVSSLGQVEIGQYGDLVTNAGKQVANGLGIAVPAGQVGPLMGMIAVTRPLALVKRFGEAA